MKQPSLRTEDGAEFFGLVEPIEGQFRASCYAKIDHQIEGQEFKICRSEDEALKWDCAAGWSTPLCYMMEIDAYLSEPPRFRGDEAEFVHCVLTGGRPAPQDKLGSNATSTVKS
jgi:hypothetical protein